MAGEQLDTNETKISTRGNSARCRVGRVLREIGRLEDKKTERKRTQWPERWARKTGRSGFTRVWAFPAFRPRQEVPEVLEMKTKHKAKRTEGKRNQQKNTRLAFAAQWFSGYTKRIFARRGYVQSSPCGSGLLLVEVGVPRVTDRISSIYSVRSTGLRVHMPTERVKWYLWPLSSPEWTCCVLSR